MHSPICKTVVKIPLALLSILDTAQSMAAVSEANVSAIEEVVVTAEKREESLQDVGLAITAISGEAMRNQGITGIEALSGAAPGLMISENGSNIEVTLRGIVTTNFVESGDSAVSFHVDGVYYARPSSLTGTFYDIERVEVLRGPQGTLYGRNATGGNINVITRKPAAEFDAEMELGIGNYNQKTVYSMVNLPVSDTFSTRFAINSLKRDGYIGQVHVKDTSDADELAGRAQALWEPGDRTSLLISADYYQREGASTGRVDFPVGRKPDFSGTANTESSVDNSLWGASVQLDVDFDGFTLTSLTAYRDNERSEYGDSDNTDLDDAISYAVVDADQWSQEIRFTSNSDSDLEWVGGVYYIEEDQAVFLTVSDAIADGTGLSFDQPDTESKSTAIFGQATYHLSDAVRAIIGLRYTKDEKSRLGGTYLASGSDPLDPSYDALAELLSENIAHVDWRKASWKLGVEWDAASDSMLYANLGTAYKAGGYYDGLPPNDYDPEEILAFSIGAKNRFLDNRLQLNAEIFYYLYEGFQTSVVDFIKPIGSDARGLVTYNADEANLYGLEAEAAILIGEGGILDVSMGYLHTEFSDFVVPPNEASGEPEQDLSGTELSKAPELTFSIAYRHRWILNSGATLSARISANYSDKYYVNYVNDPMGIQDSFVKSDASLSYHPADHGWSVSAYINNINDEIVRTSGDNGAETAGVTLIGSSLAPPRTYGVKVGWRF